MLLQCCISKAFILILYKAQNEDEYYPSSIKQTVERMKMGSDTVLILHIRDYFSSNCSKVASGDVQISVAVSVINIIKEK